MPDEDAPTAPVRTPDGRFEWNGHAWVRGPVWRRRTVLNIVVVAAVTGALALVLMAIVLAPALIGLFRVFH